MSVCCLHCSKMWNLRSIYDELGSEIADRIIHEIDLHQKEYIIVNLGNNEAFFYEEKYCLM